MANFLTETVKRFLKNPNRDPNKDSSKVHNVDTLSNLPNDSDLRSGSFFDIDPESQFGGGFYHAEISDILIRQREKILEYRQLAMNPDVSNALDDIVNEIIFVYDNISPLKLEMTENENQKLQKAIQDAFETVERMIGIKKNLFNIVKSSYVDGQCILHLAYDKVHQKEGIKRIRQIDPINFYFDMEKKKYRYFRNELTSKNLYQVVELDPTEYEYDPEEIVRVDFGLHQDNLNLSYLEEAIKSANMLKTLEDLLIPLRFSRSISRRVFNVDIGDLPSKRGEEIMREYQKKFKYKKFYNNETGEVTNQQHITSMVEDYWFANRSGSRGTTVDLLDESGNLGELNDILYFAKKLYRSLKIPSNRIEINPDGDHDFSYDSNQVSKEDLKFFMFISRVRQVYTELFKEVLKREVVSTGIMTEKEWLENEMNINIQFVNENTFIEKMNIDTFNSKMDIYKNIVDEQGKIFPVRYILSKIFNMSDNEIDDNLNAIQKEKKDKRLEQFYTQDDNRF